MQIWPRRTPPLPAGLNGRETSKDACIIVPFYLHSFRQSSGDLLALGVKYLPTLMAMANGGGGGGGAGNAAIGSLLANGLGSMLAGGGGGGGSGGAGGGLRDGFLYKSVYSTG